MDSSVPSGRGKNSGQYSRCTKEACSFRDLHRKILDLDTVVLGVSRDSLASHDRFIGQFGLPFVLLSDPDASMMKNYGAFGEKKSYGKTMLEVIRSTVIVDKGGKVLKYWRLVKNADDDCKKKGQLLSLRLCR